MTLYQSTCVHFVYSSFCRLISLVLSIHPSIHPSWFPEQLKSRVFGKSAGTPTIKKIQTISSKAGMQPEICDWSPYFFLNFQVKKNHMGFFGNPDLSICLRLYDCHVDLGSSQKPQRFTDMVCFYSVLWQKNNTEDTTFAPCVNIIQFWATCKVN